MLNHQTMEKLHAMRLTGMANAYRQQMEDMQMAGPRFSSRRPSSFSERQST